MPAIVNPTEEVGALVLSLAASAIGLKRASGTVDLFMTWDPVQGDVTIAAPVGTTGGGGTRRISFASDVAVALTLAVTGLATIGGTLNVVGNFSVATNKLTVAAATGNIVGAGTLTMTGVITAAGGLLITGGGFVAGSISKAAADGLQIGAITGSTNDFALYNAAGSLAILRTPTGTANAIFGGIITASAGVLFAGGGFAAGTIYKSASLGLVIAGITGSSADLTITSNSGGTVMSIPPGTINAQFAGRISAVLPTSALGLVAGDLWRNGTVVNIV